MFWGSYVTKEGVLPAVLPLLCDYRFPFELAQTAEESAPNFRAVFADPSFLHLVLPGLVKVQPKEEYDGDGGAHLQKCGEPFQIHHSTEL